MIVNLSLLDKLPAVAYDEAVGVALAGDKYEEIGTCKISINNGQLIGELSVDRELDGNLFFYYTFSPYREGVPRFTGLQFNVKERSDSSTTQLKDMIIG